MSLREDQLQILSILSENLSTHNPQLVPTSTIAEKTGFRIPQLHQLLKSMNGRGIIQADDELQYSLITKKGLVHLQEHQLQVLHHPSQT